MASDRTKKLTEGRPMSLIISFALPLLSGMLFQQFYSLVDTIIVGKCLGVDALAAVGSTGSVNFLIVGFVMGVCSGFTIPIAQRFGAESYDSMRKYITNSIIVSGIIAIVMTVVVCALSRQILMWMRTPQNIIEGAHSYIFYIFLGIPVVIVYNLSSGIMRSLGDSKTPVYFLMLASVINIILDFVFILVFKTGVEGPAIATVISQLISGVACSVYLYKKYPLIKTTKSDWQLEPHHVSVLCSMGIPMGLQYSITAIGAVILQTAVNGIGSDAVAAITAGSKLSMFIVCPFDALGSTMATYAGQNIGARKVDRVKKGTSSAMVLGAIYSVTAFAIIYFASKYLLLLFLDSAETTIIANARQFLIVNSVMYVFLAGVNIIRFSIQGMGYSMIAICAGVLEMIARALVAVALVPKFGFGGAILANPIAWIMADMFLVPCFLTLAKKKQIEFNSKS